VPVVAPICALFLIAATPALAQPTQLRVVLTPSAANGEIDRLGVELRFRELPVAAANAGPREGDAIISITRFSELQNNPDKLMKW